jgi:hypothetical protein
LGFHKTNLDLKDMIHRSYNKNLQFFSKTLKLYELA